MGIIVFSRWLVNVLELDKCPILVLYGFAVPVYTSVAEYTPPF
jgi:hypothetical protein